jgi:hypothetical protein
MCTFTKRLLCKEGAATIVIQNWFPNQSDTISIFCPIIQHILLESGFRKSTVPGTT